MSARVLLWGLAALATLSAQEVCPPTPTYSPCDIVLEMSAADAAQHPNPYLTVTLHAEFQSPRHRTVMMPGFWDGGRRFVIRFTPTDPGDWPFRVTSSLASINGKSGSFSATDSGHPGFLKPDNYRAWSTTEKRQPHLWMGDNLLDFAWMDRAQFDTVVNARAAQHFNHIRGLVMSPDQSRKPAFTSPDQPDPTFFQELERRVHAMNAKGIYADLILAGPNGHFAKVFPQAAQRERFLRYMISRFSAMMITWQGFEDFESYNGGRALLKEVGLYLKQHDPFNHPRSTGTLATSASLIGDGWMTHIIYRSSSVPLAAIERQLYNLPMVNVSLGETATGDEFRKRLWRMTMNGQYPAFGNMAPESPEATAMKAWFELFERTRYWELEPNFEVEGGVSLALGGIEYIVYLEKPGPVDLVTERKGYEVYWMRPSTGEIIKEKKDYKGEKFHGEPPDSSSDWVLHLSRDGRKESMAKSWKFESRPVLMQEPERLPAKVPFEIVQPAEDLLPVDKPIPFSVRLTKETRASKAMMYLWTAESTADNQGYRVLATTGKGDFRIPSNIALRYPTVINLRLYGINANGKVYQLDRVLKANP